MTSSKMKMGSMAWATMAITAVMVMNLSVRQGPEAQVACLQMDGWGAPLGDANNLVQFWRQSTDSYCTNGTARLYWMLHQTQWDALGIWGWCVPASTCVAYFDMGNYLNEVLAECNEQSGVVQGHNHVSADMDFYLSSMAGLPDCIPPGD